jgi:hypothetical protein
MPYEMLQAVINVHSYKRNTIVNQPKETATQVVRIVCLLNSRVMKGADLNSHKVHPSKSNYLQEGIRTKNQR